MALTSGTGGIGPVRPVRPYSVGIEAAARTRTAEGSFDKIAISQDVSAGHRFQMEIVGRLSQEVRTAVTTGDIQELRRQVLSGEYRPDAREIAARMLMMEGAD